MEFSRQEDWSGLLCPSAGAYPDPGIKPGSSALQRDSLLSLQKPPRVEPEMLHLGIQNSNDTQTLLPALQRQ